MIMAPRKTSSPLPVFFFIYNINYLNDKLNVNISSSVFVILWLIFREKAYLILW